MDANRLEMLIKQSVIVKEIGLKSGRQFRDIKEIKEVNSLNANENLFSVKLKEETLIVSSEDIEFVAIEN